MFGSTPNIQSAIKAWGKLTKVFVVGRRVDSFMLHESFYRNYVRLIRIPNGQQIEYKPEGTRRWNKEQVYSESSLDLKLDDVISFGCAEGEKFRVVGRTDFTDYGYIQYDLMSDYNA